LTCIVTFETRMRKINNCCVLPNSCIVCTSERGTLTIFDVENLACVATFKGKTKIICCCVLPNGSVVSGSADRTIKHWDISSLSCINTVNGLSITDCCTFGNGNFLSTSSDGTLRLWALNWSEYSASHQFDNNIHG